ncbi:MAG TPA: B12-binding domain-containing radical SAM protein, partial [Verrucomicrobiales bacterium]|nr:B12-binding domain-containing radical SAM protein [Verrucomicrobiales bacterium]
MHSKIILVTLNAKYIHASFGLRYLHANMQELAERTSILEFDINQKINDIAESILDKSPTILGFGIYIWNVEPTSKLVSILRKLKPDLKIIVGGPEVSYEHSEQEWLKQVDYLITGEADLAFYDLCKDLLIEPEAGRWTQKKVIHASVPDVKSIHHPYDLYASADLENRIVYVEASRGCPFTCEFCLSSLDVPVRAFPINPFLQAMDQLFQRGLRHFKFVDRTFNLNMNTGKAILHFFLERMEPGLFLHFEMIPDRLPEPLREIIAKFPEGSIQFEIGIQS